jgi:hypothetical protein
MHFPETELSTVTTAALVLAKPVLQELQVGVAYAGKDCPTSKMLTMATRSFLTWGFYPLIVTVRFSTAIWGCTAQAKVRIRSTRGQAELVKCAH